MSDFEMAGVADLAALAHPQPMFKLLRDAAPVVPMEEMGMMLVGGEAEVRKVLHHPEIFSFDATFEPQADPAAADDRHAAWSRAVERSRGWDT